MIRKIFRFESRKMWKLCVALLVLCALGIIGFSLAAIGGRDARTADCADLAFEFLIGMSYVGPVLLLLAVIVGERLSHYRMAGVKDSDAAAGRHLTVFVWTSVFILGELLLATLFDALFFIGRLTVRNQVLQSSFLLSLRAHGVLRLLFAPSVGVTMTLLYFVYDLFKVTVKRPCHMAGKVLGAVVLTGILYLCSCTLLTLCGMDLSLDLNLLAAPDSVLPLGYAMKWTLFEKDVVKDFHLFAASIFNAVYLGETAVFVLAGFFYKRWLGRSQNEIEE